MDALHKPDSGLAVTPDTNFFADETEASLPVEPAALAGDLEDEPLLGAMEGYRRSLGGLMQAGSLDL